MNSWKEFVLSYLSLLNLIFAMPLFIENSSPGFADFQAIEFFNSFVYSSGFIEDNNTYSRKVETFHESQGKIPKVTSKVT